MKGSDTSSLFLNEDDLDTNTELDNFWKNRAVYVASSEEEQEQSEAPKPKVGEDSKARDRRRDSVLSNHFRQLRCGHRPKRSMNADE